MRDTLERWRYRFQGRVQGVGFRATAADCAQNQPVTGWVRNDADGGVTLELQGSPKAVLAVVSLLVERCSGHIRTVDRAPARPEPEEVSFRIRR